MTIDNGAVTVRVAGRIGDIAAADWDACAGAGDPFVSHAFLAAMEDSGSACARTGWAPQHLVVEDADGQMLACAPLYLKSHSFGEYVFDWNWAEAYQRAGGAYYPKLQCAVPFTPVSGRRLLVRPGVERAPLERTLVAAMIALARRRGVSSLHVAFSTEAEWRHLQQAGLLARVGQQYHWHNRGYGAFGDFLAALSSRKRKAIRKERAQANAQGVDIAVLTGDAIGAEHWDSFHRFYLGTVEKKWANAYLTRDFFDRLGAALGPRIVLIWATRDGRAVAGALNLLGDGVLHGRLWGAEENFRFLHFEMCYYRAIDYAITRGLARVEAGAQGEHKIQRGYLPQRTYSAHWIADAGFRAVVDRFLVHEREMIEADIADLSAAGPYHRCG